MGCGKGRRQLRILFLTHYFPPEVNAPASRTYEHAREWARLGHAVTVVTCFPNHPTGRLYTGFRNRLWQCDDMNGVWVIRVWTYLAPNHGFVRRNLNYISYFLAACIAIPFLPRADVVISTSPQFFCGLAGYVVSRLKQTPWVLEIRDLWPESIVAVGALRAGPVIGLLEALERFMYRKAEHVVALTEAFAEHITARGATPGKVTVIKNGVDLEHFVRPVNGSLALRAELGLPDQFVAGYLGTIGMAHQLETVLDAAARLRGQSSVAFLIVGAGAARAALCRLREARGLDNVIILDQQPKERMPALWANCDASLVLLRNVPQFAKVLPSKLFESMAMGLPIILGVDGESRALVEQVGCGIAISPEDAEGLANAVCTLAADPDHARSMGERGRRYVAVHHDRARIASRFAALLEDMAASPHQSLRHAWRRRLPSRWGGAT
jgi:glycosyltransferase involved in cell wall biosynthesis